MDAIPAITEPHRKSLISKQTSAPLGDGLSLLHKAYCFPPHNSHELEDKAGGAV